MLTLEVSECMRIIVSRRGSGERSSDRWARYREGKDASYSTPGDVS
jgi:hypothetical protein